MEDDVQFAGRKRSRQRLLCTACQAEADRGATITRLGRITTRASYRAALRHRQQQAQLDLVDLVVPAP